VTDTAFFREQPVTFVCVSRELRADQRIRRRKGHCCPPQHYVEGNYNLGAYKFRDAYTGWLEIYNEAA
jgi:hypothetical protein